MGSYGDFTPGEPIHGTLNWETDDPDGARERQAAHNYGHKRQCPVCGGRMTDRASRCKGCAMRALGAARRGASRAAARWDRLNTVGDMMAAACQRLGLTEEDNDELDRDEG